MDHSSTIQGLVEVGGYTAVSGSLQITQDMVDVTTFGSSKPDPEWEVRDRKGHFHAYTKDGKTPTLTSRVKDFTPCGDPIECGCGGSEVRAMYCVICLEEIEPKRVADPGPNLIPGRRHWAVHATGNLPIGNGTLTTVRFRSGVASIVDTGRQRHWFGIARVVHVAFGDSGPSWLRLEGAGELGER